MFPDSPAVDNAAKKGLRAFFIASYELFRQLLDFIKNIPEIPKYWSETSKQINKHIYETLPLGLLIGCLVGITSSIQAKTQASIWVARLHIVNIMFKFGILDLYPLILGLVLAGKIGSSVAAEIGSMRITEQIDALKTMSIHPIGYLGWPKVTASIVMFPLITIFSDLFALVSMAVVSLYVFSWITYDDLISGLRADFRPAFLITQMVIKPALFGFIICFIGYFFGSRASKGAKGVGQASVQSAVVSALIIIFLNHIIGELTY
jgi:phospholipid/cholesterol/gamma-HCH transport system permease protein